MMKIYGNTNKLFHRVKKKTIFRKVFKISSERKKEVLYKDPSSNPDAKNIVEKYTKFFHHLCGIFLELLYNIEAAYI